MKIKCVTALFDIKRDKLGDGRTIEDYLLWFDKTLSLKCDFIIYTEEKFKEFVLNSRSKSEYETEIIIQKLEEIPYFHKKDLIHSIINSGVYKSKMADLNRIECYLAEYNVIQFSKFGWLKSTVEKNPDLDLFWIDAGCSRFFDTFDISQKWPNADLLDLDKIIIQKNSNFNNFFPNLKIETFMWNNHSIVAGTLFGANPDNIIYLHDEFMNILDYCESKNCVNVDQNALAIFVKKNPERCNLFIGLDGTHLPLFKFLGRKN
jgi:hypothetical protein